MPRPTKRDLPVAVMIRIMERCGAERVSRKAADSLALEIEGIVKETMPLILSLTKAAGRKTVHDTDVQAAFAHNKNKKVR